jgi:2-C-methyl-D-erythritol 4-phosphate cytidylyltransferase/2-C-methyl-D-erythritol 2,4-cyclodiphosphate synthase
VVAGGSGARFGDATPKQYLPLAGRRVLDWSIEAARSVSDGVVLVVPADRVGDAEPCADVVVAGGVTRSDSVRAGIGAVPDDATVIVVHDAARPLASARTFEAVVDAVRSGAHGAVPGVAVVDTVKQAADGRVVATLDRTALVAVQTPQAFDASWLRAAHEGQPDATDDAALVEAAGGTVVVAPGDRTNTKITVAGDLAAADALLRERHAVGPASTGPIVAVRVGQGFDVHAFSDDPGRRLVLGGVEFAGERGLVGHSDADVVAHVCADALLGAAGLGDLGQHFSDADPQWAGADSLVLLAAVATMVREEGWRIGNVDCAVVCERPKLAPERDRMQQRLSDCVGAPVTVKGNRAEGLGALGRGEGVAAWATAVVTR